MPTITITKSYQDGDVLLEQDLDDIRDSIETFLNTTKIDSANIQDLSIPTIKLQDASVTAAKLDTDAVTTVKILDEAVTEDKLAAGLLTEATEEYSFLINGIPYIKDDWDGGRYVKRASTINTLAYVVIDGGPIGNTTVQIAKNGSPHESFNIAGTGVGNKVKGTLTFSTPMSVVAGDDITLNVTAVNDAKDFYIKVY